MPILVNRYFEMRAGDTTFREKSLEGASRQACLGRLDVALSATYHDDKFACKCV